MRRLIIKIIPITLFVIAIILLSVFIISPFFEKKQDLNPRVVEDGKMEQVEQDNNTI